jgi:Serine carboxypeptidase S28
MLRNAALLLAAAVLGASASAVRVNHGAEEFTAFPILPPSLGFRAAAEKVAAKSGAAAVPEMFFKNRVDHFDQQNLDTYPQRYFLNDEYFSPELGGPIFFQIGGEGAVSAADVQVLMMSHYAKENGALQVTLEHRFYGKSHPFKDMATENLQYLTSQQALADAAAFIESLFEKYPTTHRRMVIFGGSYPGALAAWFRVKYPHLAVAAVSSSSPVHAVEDMVQYLDVVDQSLDKIGGQKCDAAVRSAFSQLDSLLKTKEGRAQVSKNFSTCTPLPESDPLTTANFLSSVIGTFMGTVQYNREIPNALTVKELCVDMESTADSYANLVAVAQKYIVPKGQCLGVSFDKMITQLQNLTAWGVNSVGMRQWTYQTCNEFGFFQTTDGKDQPFGTGVPLTFYTEICNRLFSLPKGPHIAFSNTNYGSNKPLGATRILFVNGNVDPWHSLSVFHSLTPSLKAILIEGTAHCANMMPPRPNDLPGLLVARNQTSLQVREWLAAPWQ